MLRSKTADKQGTHRLARGNHYYQFSKEVAKTLEMKIDWELEIIPNVGHNQKKMAAAAAKFLYE